MPPMEWMALWIEWVTMAFTSYSKKQRKRNRDRKQEGGRGKERGGERIDGRRQQISNIKNERQ